MEQLFFEGLSSFVRYYTKEWWKTVFTYVENLYRKTCPPDWARDLLQWY